MSSSSAVADPAYSGESAFSDYRRNARARKAARRDHRHAERAACARAARRASSAACRCSCEKPIADTVAAANALVSAARRVGVPLLVGAPPALHPSSLEKARELVQGGQHRPPAPRSPRCGCCRSRRVFRRRMAPRSAAAGQLLINAIHRHRRSAGFVCGEIDERARARVQRAAAEFDVESDTAPRSCAALCERRAGAPSRLYRMRQVAPWRWRAHGG